MKNGDKLAYPVHGGYTDDDPRNKILGGGLTKREMFAMSAPPIPDWFEYESKLVKPVEPKSWTQIENKKDAHECRDWINGPSYDLRDDLKWFQYAWECYWDDMFDYKKNLAAEKFFAWRIFFADELLKQL